MKKIICSVFIAAGLFTSCSSDDDNGTNTPLNPTPDVYQFERNGKSSVSYSGQTDRLMMGAELGSALKDPANTQAVLEGMFTNTGNHFENEALNSSSKNIRSKTAASKDYFAANTTESNVYKADFDTWIANQVNEVFSNWNTTASPGVAGKIEEAGGKVRYVNAKGLEYDQAFMKGLIGALVTDQILNNYLSPAVLDEADNREQNDNELLATDKNYTTMEHKWDEAFGYLYGTDNAANPQLDADSFLNKYLGKVDEDEDFSGIADSIYNAFIAGRAAIVNKDYELRDQQVAIIREKISMLIGIRAVYYLQAAKESLGTDPAAAFHDLSEAYGFIYSLRFTRMPGTETPYLSDVEVRDILSELTKNNGFWDVTPATLDQTANAIASKFSFTLEQAATN